MSLSCNIPDNFTKEAKQSSLNRPLVSIFCASHVSSFMDKTKKKEELKANDFVKEEALS